MFELLYFVAYYLLFSFWPWAIN